MGRNLDLAKWKKAPGALKYRQIIGKAERLITIHGNEAAGGIMAAANELKKALIMDWDQSIINKMKINLEREIILLEEEEKL